MTRGILFDLNGTLIGSHEGQEVGFEIEATAAIKPGENNVLVVRVFQPALTNASPEMTISNIPKGQSWGGIQRSVDLYATAPVAITDLYSIPDMQTGTIRNRITISNPYDAELMAYSPQLFADGIYRGILDYYGLR